jgi:hypothetical protein
VTPPYPVRPRRFLRSLVEVTYQAFLSVVLTIVIFRLGNMQLDGLLTFGGISIGLLFGFTSLLYNRARSFPNGPTQRRTLFVAELALRSTLSFVLGTAITTVIYLFLSSGSFVATPMQKIPTQILPAVCTLIPLAFASYSFVLLVRATRVLLHGLLVPFNLKSNKRLA